MGTKNHTLLWSIIGEDRYETTLDREALREILIESEIPTDQRNKIEIEIDDDGVRIRWSNYRNTRQN